MEVTIYHNQDRDAGFGINTLIEDHAPKYQAGAHELKLVYHFHEYRFGRYDFEVLEALWERFNIGDDAIAKEYRAHNLRSLSVGDVAMIDDRYYSCETVGWAERVPTELNLAGE